MRQHVEFKVATLVHQAMSEHAPSYLADDYCLVTNLFLKKTTALGCDSNATRQSVQLDLVFATSFLWTSDMSYSRFDSR